MIFIDLENFSPSDDWSYEAWQLTKELIVKATLEDKFKFIEDNKAFWGKLKSELPFSMKCWYSESRESVSVYEIEHFRPTKAVCRSSSVFKILKPVREAVRKDWLKETKYKGIGYWWLAFDYLNYRNCGKKINMKKGIRFPLIENSFIAYNNTDNHHNEVATLLDPTNRKDPALLTFDPDGKARPTLLDKSDIDYIRAYVSIEVYGLNSIETLVKHREGRWSEYYKAIRRAGKKYSELENASSEGNFIIFNEVFQDFMDFVDNDLKPAISSQAEFSAVAKACLLSYSSFEWINEYVLN